MTLKCILVEDSQGASRLIESFLYKISTVQVLGVCQDLDTLEQELKAQEVDALLLVLDQINLEDWMFLDKLPNRPAIILCSANNLAIEAFNIRAADFIAAPAALDTVSQSIHKIITQRIAQQNEQLAIDKKRNYFFVKSDYKIVKVDFDTILYIEGLGEYVRIYTENEKVVTLLSLAKLEKTLPKDDFIRTHRSYIINVNKIEFVQNNMITIGNNQLPISKSQRKTFLSFIDANGLL